MIDLSLFSIEGRTALVTGASRGLGKACALALAGAGANVVCTGRDLQGLNQTAASVQEKGRKSLVVTADVLDEDSIRRVIKETVDRFGSIHILVNNAGVSEVRRVEHLDPLEWDRVLNTNLKAAFLFCKHVLPHMKKQKYGRIINMSSLGGIRGSKNLSCYNASKAGLIRFSESLALEVIGDNITVNCLCPGFFITDMNRRFFETDKGKAEINKFPMKRAGDLKEIAGALIFLASDASSYVTATALIVDGAQRWKGA
jgi:NAD(P)-dependent dehydrogenase (short-subunit alcohol dehydrogenase family)